MRCRKIGLFLLLPAAGVWASNAKEVAKVEVCADVIRQFVRIPENAAPPLVQVLNQHTQ
ncbi:MAG: hypothetical protein U9Q58_06475 [Pseudomonadota bacterium]|nr:hypothetical protein [Pseudomonadota bacterium]